MVIWRDRRRIRLRTRCVGQTERAAAKLINRFLRLLELLHGGVHPVCRRENLYQPTHDLRRMMRLTFVDVLPGVTKLLKRFSEMLRIGVFVGELCELLSERLGQIEPTGGDCALELLLEFVRGFGHQFSNARIGGVGLTNGRRSDLNCVAMIMKTTITARPRATPRPPNVLRMSSICPTKSTLTLLVRGSTESFCSSSAAALPMSRRSVCMKMWAARVS